MKTKVLAYTVLAISLLMPISANAATYDVVTQAGSLRMEGTFTIDDIGTINSASQILDYNLVIGVGNPAVDGTLTPLNSTISIRGDYFMTATGTELIMNIGFSGRFRIENDSHSWRFQSISGGSPIHGIDGANLFNTDPNPFSPNRNIGGIRNVAAGTTERIGTAVAPTPIPLPAALPLLAGGLGLLGFIGLLRRRTASA